MLDPDETTDSAIQRVTELLRKAEQEQREIEDRELIARELDQEKVESFKEAAVKGWSEARLAPDLLKLAGSSLYLTDPKDFSKGRFGFTPRLEPKGMFVTPTNFVGVERHGEHLGSELARGEVVQVVKVAVDHARPTRGQGTALDRLNILLDQLRSDGYTPNLILIPINWRLARELGLSE